jgi:hypothetical protein
MSDEELIAFSRRNKPYRIERNAAGELEIMSPVGMYGSHWEAVVIRELDGRAWWVPFQFERRIQPAGQFHAQPRCGMDL